MKSVLEYIKVFAAIAVAAMFATGCTDLVENPTSEITEENFEPSERDIPNLVAPVYTPLRSFMSCCYPYVGMQDESADVSVKPLRPGGTWGGPYLPWHRHNWAPNHFYVGNFDRTGNWEVFFNGINAANRVLSQVESGEIPIEGEPRAKLVAELKVARAFYYMLLMDNFGNVPIVTSFDTEEPPEQSSRQEVYDFVVQQLTDNIPNLSETVDQSTYGRFNKWAGKMVLAEVYLNAGVYRGDVRDVDAGQNGEWEKVIQVTNDIINTGRYQLEPDYRASFVRENQSSDEIIFAIPYDEVQAGGNTMHMSNLTSEARQAFDMRASPWGGASGQPQFTGSYDEKDQRLEDSWITGTLRGPQGDSVTTYRRNIPRLTDTEYTDGYKSEKYEIYEGLQVSSDVDMPFYRYAETLLMKAEALLRTGRGDQAAEIVTQVRERSFEDPADATVTASELKQPSVVNWGIWLDGEVVEPDTGPEIKYGRFMDELGWEFAMEGHRRQDMIRFGAFTTKSWFRHEASESYKRLFPIPIVALDTNPNVNQNPGY